MYNDDTRRKLDEARRRAKAKEEGAVMVMREDGLIDFVPEKEHKRNRRLAKKEKRKEYNENRKHTKNDLTIIAIVNIVPAAYFASHLRGAWAPLVLLALMALLLYAYWMDEWEK